MNDDIVHTLCMYIFHDIVTGVLPLFELALKVLMTNINGEEDS